MISGDARWEVICDRMEAEKRQMRRLRVAAYGIIGLALGGAVLAMLGSSKTPAAIVWSVATVAGLVWLSFSQRLLRAMRATLDEMRAIAEAHTKRWHAICEGEKR